MSTLFALALAAAPAPPAGLPDPPRVDLTLTGADAFRNGNQTLFRLRVELDNRTGREVVARSNCGSAFDGLQVVVRDAAGKELARQSVAYHKSPFAEAVRCPLPPGKTRDTVTALVDLPAEARTLRVSVYGTLPQSGIDDLLLTDVLPVTVRPNP